MAKEKTNEMLDHFQPASPPHGTPLQLPQVTLCRWWEGLILRQGGPLGIQEEIVEEIDFLFDGGHLVAMFV